MSNRHTRGTSSTPAWRPSPRTSPCRVQRAHDGRIVGDLAAAPPGRRRARRAGGGRTGGSGQPTGVRAPSRSSHSAVCAGSESTCHIAAGSSKLSMKASATCWWRAAAPSRSCGLRRDPGRGAQPLALHRRPAARRGRGGGERRAARPDRGAPGGRRGRRPAASGRGAQPRPRVLDLLARYAPGVREQGRPSGRGMDQRVHAAPPPHAQVEHSDRAGQPVRAALRSRRRTDAEIDGGPAGAPRMRSAGEEPRNTGLLVERCR